MNFTFSVFFAGVMFLSVVNALEIKRIESTTPKATTPRTTTPEFTTVSPNNPVQNPEAKGPIVVLQHHGTLDGPSGRFMKTEFQAAPPVDLSLPPVFLPEFIPVREDVQEEMIAASSNIQPDFARTQYLAAPPIDLNSPPVFLPEATPIYEPSREGNAARQALYFVRG